MAETIKPTRSELIKLKNRIKLARVGYNILKKKRDGLILEFFEILKRAKTVRQELVTEYKQALHIINIARTVEGDISVRSIALAVKDIPSLSIAQRNIMGVIVPAIVFEQKEKGIDRGYGTISSSAVIDDAASAFDKVLVKVIEAAEVETSLKKLLNEIEKTKRRVNALEFEIIPKLEHQMKFIQMRLDEMERENIFRMKRIKK